MVIIETAIFTRTIEPLMDDDELRALQENLAQQQLSMLKSIVERWSVE